MSRAIWLFILTLAASAASATAQSAPGTPSVSDARSLIAQGKTQDAQRELNALAAIHPEPLGVERLRGILAYQNSRLNDAEASFVNAVHQDPTDLQSLQMQGIVLYRMGKPAEAIPLLEKAHAAGSIANADPNYVLGLCYVATGRYNDARHAFAVQYDFEPDSAAAWLLTARMLFRQEMTGAAADAAKRASQIDPHIPLAHRLLGEIALAGGDVPTAVVELEKERQLNPMDGETYDRLGDAYLRAGQPARAQQVLDRAVLLEPNSTGPYILLGKALLEQQDSLMAAMYLERAASMDPSNSMTHMLLGRAYAASGRKDDAQREFLTLQRLHDAKAPETTAP